MKLQTTQQYLFKLNLTLLLALTLWATWAALPAYAQGPIVTSTEPISNANNVTSTTNITVAFDTALDSATVSTQSLTIRGEQTGIYAGSYSFPASNRVLIDPTAEFKPGEVVRVVASSQIESTGGITATPYQWQFTATSQNGTGTGDVWQEQTIKGNFSKANAVYAADVDGDGDLDILGTAYNADDITWWENNGNQSFTAHTINGNFDGAWDVYAADVDGDGDMDVLGAATLANDITWWENDGNQSFSEHLIDGSFSGAVSVYSADMDGDGDIDILGAAQNGNQITWWENDGNQSFTEHTIDGGFNGAWSVYAVDVDGDGDMDVLGAAANADDIAWWENDGAQTFSKHTIEGNFDGAWSVYAADVDGDGDMDVLGAATNANDITWWENDGNQSFSEHPLNADFGGAESVYAADVDGDGDMDVLGAAFSAGTIAWWENDGNESFTEHNIDAGFNGARDVYAADVDGDGDLDVLGAAYSANDIAVWYNIAPEIAVLGNDTEISNGDTNPTTTDSTDFGNVGLGNTLTRTFTISNQGVAETDTLLLTGSPTVNLSGSDTFTLTQPLSTSLAIGQMTSFTVTFQPQSFGTVTATLSLASNDADEGTTTFVVQGRGQPSVQAVLPLENDLNVSASSSISLTYDVDLAGSSVSSTSVTVRGEQTGIYTGSYSLPSADTILIDPTAEFKPGEVVRVIASSQVESTAALTTTPYQWQFTATSQDGSGQGDVWQEQIVKQNFDGAYDVRAADMDGDGDLDVLGAAELASDITWWENDGAQNFSKHTIDNNFSSAESVYAADVDGDGDLDVLGAAFNADDITWWENDGNQNFSEHTIAGDFDGANTVYAADVDGDGDLDVLGTALVADDITWWENDGNQTFSEHTISDNFNAPRGIYAADVDSDGDMDVLGAAYTADDITWWENDGNQNFSEHTIEGDFNGANSVYAADVDGDGDMDVLGAAVIADDITWWENDGNQTFTEHTIDGSFDGAVSVYAADMDGDGDLDVLGGGYYANDIAWWENDGNQNFTKQTIDDSFNSARAVYAADMDGDGDLDTLGAAGGADEITIWYNTAPEIAVLGNGTEISNGDTSPATSDDTDFGFVAMGTELSHTFTISNQGQAETDTLLLTDSPTINLSNSTHFTVTQALSTNLAAGEATTFTVTFQPQSTGLFSTTVSLANNDADENPTAFVVQGVGQAAVQAVSPNENSLNVSATESVSLTYNADIAASSVSTTSITVRGEQTGIYTGSYSLPTADTILIDPTAQFKPGEVVRVVASSQVESTDAITATPYQWQFTATSQDGTGQGDVWQEQTIEGSFDGATSVYAADVDGDGDLDILGTASESSDAITWWENDGNQNFTEHTIKDNFITASSVYATDLDGDGDLDILGAAFYDDDITWWENDGNQNFTEHIINGDFDGAWDVYAADVDGDGDMDVLGAAWNADDITWWENDGEQNFTEHTINDNFDAANSVYAADIDGDGDMDVLGTADHDAEITWWENDGNQTFTEHTLNAYYRGVGSAYAADVDGDGDMDILSAGESNYNHETTWWENDGDQNFTEHIISDSLNLPHSVYAADVDGDGDMDVLGAATNANDITWWENDGSQTFTAHTIKGNFKGAFSVYAADVDGDGDMDVLGAAYNADDITVWYNTAPEIAVLGNDTAISNGDTSPATTDDTDFGNVTVGEALTHTFTISSAGTSTTDYLILSGSPAITLSNSTHFTLTQALITTLAGGESTTFTLTFAPSSRGTFTDTITIISNDTDEATTTFVVQGTAVGGQVQTVYPVESSLNVTSTSNISLSYDIDLAGSSVSSTSVTVRGEQTGIYSGSYSLLAADTILIDPASPFKAGEVVRVVASSQVESTAALTATAYQWQFTATSQDGTGTGDVWQEQTIVDNYSYASSVYAADMDGDGDMDLLATAFNDSGVTWWENDGQQNFTQYVIEEDFEYAASAYAADVDGDGDMDVLGAAYTADDIAWWENDGAQNFTQHTIKDNFIGASSVYAADVDGDGDLDVLGTATYADDITWWENDGAQNFSEHTIKGNFNGAGSVYPADVDGDGDLDIFGAANNANAVLWWENDGNQTFSQHTINGDFGGASSVYTADVDGDGDLDILGAAFNADDIVWWENDGAQNFTENTIKGNFNGAVSVYAADMDGDGDVDILGAATNADDVTWWENDGNQNFSEHTIDGNFDGARSAYAADVDSDGDLDILAAGAYADSIIVWYNTAPEITVLGNDTEISNGDTTPAIGDDTDFGTVSVGETLTHTFTISNSGTSATDDLILNGSPTIALSNGTAFTLTQPASTTLVAGESTTFTLTFNPPSQAAFTDTVTIVNNDADENPTTFVVEGTSTCPSFPIYVSQNATGNNTGDSWTDAYTDLQDGLTLAQTCAITEIWVATGVYTPGLSQSDTFQLISGVAVYGGFATTETLRTERNWEANLTILSGDIDGNDTNSDGNFVAESTNHIQGSNSYHIVTGSGADSSAILDGFTLTAGQADSDGGGGIYNDVGSPTLANLTFSGNYAVNQGGAMHNDNNSNPDLTNVTLANNYSDWNGGAMYNDDSSPSLNNVVFSNNYSYWNGGAMYNFRSNPALSRVNFIENSSAGNGAAMYNYINSHASLSNVIISGNDAGDSGAGIYNFNSSPSLTHVTISGNDGWGMFNTNNSNPTIRNSIFWNNQAGGSIEAETQIYNDSSTPVISYTLIQSATFGGSWDTSLGTDSGHNLDADPLFVTQVNPDKAPTSAGDLRLLPGSPAIDTGDNSSAPGEDINGISRPVNGVVDMGAYESQGFSLTISGGNNQSTATDTDFADPLQVTVSSAAGEPVGPGGVISFTAPSSGAGLATTSFVATTNASGVATKTITANSTGGSYQVSVTAKGVSSPANFSLTNTGVISLSLVKSVDLLTSPVTPGDPLTYTIVISNSGNQDATSVTVEDTLPAGVDGLDLSWSGTVTAGESVTFTIAATITDEAGYGATVLNTATYNHTSDSGNDTAGFTIIADTTPPDIFGVTLITPTNGISLTNVQPTFDWTDATDSVSGVVSYTLLITNSSGSSDEITTTDSSYTPSADLATGVYTWTVQAYDAVGNMSEYVSPAETFEIVESSSGTIVYLPIVVKDN